MPNTRKDTSPRRLDTAQPRSHAGGADIVERLRATRLDKDNFPRMDSERWCSVGLACKAADEIERLNAEGKKLWLERNEAYREIERLCAENKRPLGQNWPNAYFEMKEECERLRAERDEYARQRNAQCEHDADVIEKLEAALHWTAQTCLDKACVKRAMNALARAP